MAIFRFGTNGRVSDGGVIKNTDFYQKFINGTLGLPQPGSVNGITLPYVFIGDEAFALRNDFLKPFNKSQHNETRRIVNYRLSRARRIIENVFGILVARFGILSNEINLDLDNIAPVVMACCADTYCRKIYLIEKPMKMERFKKVYKVTCLVSREEEDPVVFNLPLIVGTYS